MTDRSIDAERRANKDANLVARSYMGGFGWFTLGWVAVVVGLYVAVIIGLVGGGNPWLLGLAGGLLGYWAYVGGLHEAAHATISRRRGVGAVDNVVGWITGVVVGISFTAHRREHLAHHAYTGRAGADPDFDMIRNASGIKRYTLGVYQLQFEWYPRHAWAGAPAGERALVVVEMVVVNVFRVALIALLGWSGLIFVAVSTLVTAVVASYLIVVAVHARPEFLPEGRYVDTASYPAERLPRPIGTLVTWAWGFHNYHGIHHAWPTVPCHRMPALFRQIRPFLEDRGAPIHDLRLTRAR